MHILIIGAGGMIGRQLASRLLGEGHIDDQPIETLTLADLDPPATPPFASGDDGFSGAVRLKAVDLAVQSQAASLIADRPHLIIHLAAIVSGEAERDVAKGYRINLDGSRYLLDAIIAAHHQDGYCPKLVFASSIAVFGAPFPAAIEDSFHLTPLTSYGTQKAITELLISDFSRKGFVDGVAIRLPTICVRPGTANLAASGFFSNIIREPLNGEEAILPVDENVRHPHASPRAAIDFLLHACALNLAATLGPRRALTMPSLSVTVGEQIEALRRVAGARVVGRIRREANPEIIDIVAGWPRRFDANRALSLGFKVESSFDDIIRTHIDDALNGQFVS